MIDDGMGFQLVPWRPVLEHQLGQSITGLMTATGDVEWRFGQRRGLGI